MKRATTPSFILELPLQVSSKETSILNTRLDAARYLYNACLAESLKRLKLMRDSKAYQSACKLTKKSKEKTDTFKELNEKFGFTSSSIQKFAEQSRDACWIRTHLGSHDTQTTSLRAFQAVQEYSFKKKGKPRFKRYGTFHSLEGKSNDAVIRFRDNTIKYSGLELPCILDNSPYQQEALENKVKYCRIVRKQIKKKTRWYVQLILKGTPPARKATKLGKGTTGLDIGPSTIAIVTETSAKLVTFCEEVVLKQDEIRVIQRAMDRSRRATNPDNYNPNGTMKKGSKKWVRSVRYVQLSQKKQEIERCKKETRKREHGKLQNEIIRSCDTVKAEELSYKSFQKNYGKSVNLRAPGAFVAGLKRKITSLKGAFVGIKTRHTKLSQYDHTTNDYVKKPLSQRVHVLRDGSGSVQRDMYSAYLARFCNENFLDAGQAITAWPSMESFLRTASSYSKPTSTSSVSVSSVVSSKMKIQRQSWSSAQESRTLNEILDDVVARREPKRVQQSISSRIFGLQAGE